MSGGHRVYLGRISRNTAERDVERFFKGYGTIREICLEEEYAVIDFKETQDAKDAVCNLNGSKLHGQRVIVELCDTLKTHTKHAKRSYGDRDKSAERKKRFNHWGCRDREDEGRDRFEATHIRRRSTTRLRSRSISNQDRYSRRRATKFASYSNSRSRSNEVYNERNNNSRTQSRVARSRVSGSGSRTCSARVHRSVSRARARNECAPTKRTREVYVHRSDSKTRDHAERAPTRGSLKVRVHHSYSRLRAHNVRPRYADSNSHSRSVVTSVANKRGNCHSRSRSTRRSLSKITKDHRSRGPASSSRSYPHCVVIDDSPKRTVAPFNDVSRKRHNSRYFSTGVLCCPKKFIELEHLTDYIPHLDEDSFAGATIFSHFLAGPLLAASDTSSSSNLKSSDVVNYCRVDARSSDLRSRHSRAIEEHAGKKPRSDYSRYGSRSPACCPTKFVTKFATVSSMVPAASLVISTDSSSGSNVTSPNIVTISLPVVDESGNSRSKSREAVKPVYEACKDVKLKSSIFYHKFADVLKLTLLGSGPFSAVSNKRLQSTTFSFFISMNNIAALTRLDNNSSKKNQTRYRVCIRFFEASTIGEQDDYVPASISVRVNSRAVPILSFSKLEVNDLKKQCSQPIDITSFCHLTPNEKNSVNVSWMPETKRRLCLCIQLLYFSSAEDLLEVVIRRGIKDSEYTRTLIKRKLTANSFDNDITTTSIRISLLCPLGKVPMKMPCRSYSCTHLQCFDALTYLQMNEKKSTWICPICDMSAPFELLFIDGYFTKIIHSSSVNDIQLAENGNWYPVGNTTEESNGVKTKCISADCNGIAAAMQKTPINVVDLTD